MSVSARLSICAPGPGDRGNNVLDQNVESERWLGLGYVVQDGTFKNLGVAWRRYGVKTRYGSGSAGLYGDALDYDVCV